MIGCSWFASLVVPSSRLLTAAAPRILQSLASTFPDVRSDGIGVRGLTCVMSVRGRPALISRVSPQWDGTVAVHILEDDTGILDALKLVLEMTGERAVLHRSAESFFEAPPPAPGDLVVVDVALPGIGGVEVIRWLRRLTSAPRIVAISGQSDRYLARAFRHEPAPLVLRKPLDEAALTLLVQGIRAEQGDGPAAL